MVHVLMMFLLLLLLLLLLLCLLQRLVTARGVLVASFHPTVT
jgi:hypothetical protein